MVQEGESIQHCHRGSSGFGWRFRSTWLSHRLAARHTRQREAQFQVNVVRAIRCELEVMAECYDKSIGQFVKSVPEGQIFPVRFSLTQDWFAVFNANAAHLGRIDAELSRRIIRVYSLLKGLIEDFTINNEGLKMLERAEDDRRIRPTDKSVAEGIARLQYQLTRQAERIRESERVLKEAVDELLALLDRRGFK